MTVDAALKRIESENRKWSKINHLRFIGVPRTGTKPYFQEKPKEHKCRIIQRFSDLTFSLDFIKKTLFCEKLLIGCLLSQIFFVPL